MLETKRLNSANSIIKATMENQELEAKKEKIAKRIAKKAKIDGFRVGKVPVKLVKKMYAADIEQDAINESVKELLNKGLEELEIKEMIAEPEVSKFDEKDDGIDIVMKASIRPEIELDDYKDLIPDFTSPSRINESGLVFFIIFSISLVISITVLFFPKNTLFNDRLLSKPKCKSVITKLFLSPSIINAGYPGMILVLAINNIIIQFN